MFIDYTRFIGIDRVLIHTMSALQTQIIMLFGPSVFWHVISQATWAEDCGLLLYPDAINTRTEECYRDFILTNAVMKVARGMLA